MSRWNRCVFHHKTNPLGRTSWSRTFLLVVVVCAGGSGSRSLHAQSEGIEELSEEPGFFSIQPSEGEQGEVSPTSATRPRGRSLQPPDLPPDYALRLQELEDRVNELKEQIFRSKSRLVLLREQVLRTAIGGCQAVVTHVNDMSATFDLAQVIYSLDGNQLYSATDSGGDLADREQIEIYNGAILPGPHNISVEMIFVGNGFGLFSYLEGYRFRLRSSYAFTTEDGQIANLDIVAYERGGINQPIEDRPDIRYELDFAESTISEE